MLNYWKLRFKERVERLERTRGMASEGRTPQERRINKGGWKRLFHMCIHPWKLFSECCSGRQPVKSLQTAKGVSLCAQDENLGFKMSAYITEDITALILKRLPVKALLRFRCVCKWMKEHIDSPTLLKDHLALQHPTMIFDYTDSVEFQLLDPSTLSMDPLPCTMGLRRPDNSRVMSLLGTLHGVVCLCDWEQELLIWNPSLHKSFPLSLPVHHESRKHCGGFWINPLTKEFKIILELHFGGARQFRLYSSTRREWSVVPKMGNLRHWASYIASEVFMIGDLGHWIGSLWTDDGFVLKVNVIMSFDFKHESFEFIQAPVMRHIGEVVPCRWKGNLSLLCWTADDFPHRCDLYSQQEGDSWVRIFSFHVSVPIIKVFCALEESGRDSIRVLPEKGRVLAVAKPKWCPQELVLCEAKTGYISSKTDHRAFYESMAYDFVESMLFPD